MKSSGVKVWFALVVLSLAGTVFGDIFIGNAEFEDVPLIPGEEGWTFEIAPWECDNIIKEYPAWISYGYYDGEPEPLSPILYTEGDIVYQVLSTTYEENGAYAFSMDVALWYYEDDWRIFFYDATTGDHLTPLVARTGSNPGEEPIDALCQWYRKTVTYVAGTAEAGHQIGVGLTGFEWTMFDNAYLEAPVKACAPDPFQGEAQVSQNKTLSWHTGRDPNQPTVLNPEIKRHYLYMSSPIDADNPIGDPNLFLVGMIDVSEPAQYIPPKPLERNSIYLWRVDEGLGDIPSTDPNFLIVGDVWCFQTIGNRPVLDPASPENVMIDPGENAIFNISATNPFTDDDTGMSYQWYKVVEDDDDTPIGTNSPVLEINNAQIADQGHYYCRVTIDGTEFFTDSNTAELVIKRLMAHWPLDVDPNSVIGNVEYTAEGPIEWVDGIVDSAASFNEKDGTRVLYSTENLQRRMWTISFWAFVPELGRKDLWQDILTSGSSTYYPWDYLYVSIWVTGETDVIAFRADAPYDYSGALPYLESTWPYTTEAWYHLVTTYNAWTETLSFYVNGEKIGDADKTWYPFVEFGPYLALGADWDDTFSNAYTGLIDDMRFYSYPMSPFEIADIYMGVTQEDEVCLQRPWADLDVNCRVDINDFAWLSSEYLTIGGWSDLDFSGMTDLADLLTMLEEWMQCYSYPTCISPQ